MVGESEGRGSREVGGKDRMNGMGER